MTPAELDNELKELETRLERVRALYEQYFMGLERLQPAVPRKDLDRRIALLRKIRFQNTAKRFKFQTMIQRYNTLQQYWNRTCRDIENGTYRKHLQRAKKRFGEDDKPARSPEEAQQETQERAAQAVTARDATQADLGAMLDADIDLEAELKSALTEAKASPPPGGGLLGKLGKRDTSTSRPEGTRTSPKLGLDPPRRSGTSPNAPKLEPSTKTSPRPAGLAGLKKGDQEAKPTAPRAAATAPKPAAPKPPPLKRSATSAGAPKPAVPRPAASKPATPPPRRPAAAKPATPPPRRPAAASATGLSDDRIKNLHASYVDARKKTNASAVSYEKLEKSLRETERKLRAKHKGRNVDFDVSIQGGKAILKPKLK